MLAQRQSGVAIVLDDVMALRHLVKIDGRLLLLGDRLPLSFGRRCKQRQGFVAQRLDRPERVASL